MHLVLKALIHFIYVRVVIVNDVDIALLLHCSISVWPFILYFLSFTEFTETGAESATISSSTVCTDSN